MAERVSGVAVDYPAGVGFRAVGLLEQKNTMSKKSAPQTTGGHKVTFSNYVLQLGQRCDYSDFSPMPMLRDQLRPFANQGIHKLEKWLLGLTVTLEVGPATGSYQPAVLRHNGDGVAVMHAGFDALGGEQAWNGAHALNQHFIDRLRSTGPKEAADDLGLFLLPGPELLPPCGPAMVTSLLPEIANVPTILQVLEDFTRQLFWALHLRHTAGVNGSA